MISHFRLALRTLSGSPGFTAIAVLTLALGIGLSTSAFCFANSFLLRLLPYKDSGQLMRVYRTTPESATFPHSPAALLEIQAAQTSFENLSWYSYDQVSLGFADRPAESISGLNVSASFLSTLGVQPNQGRDFAPDDDQPGKPRQVILTHRGWQKSFGSAPDLIGTSVRLGGEPYTIIGILPPSFDAPLVWGNQDFLRPFVIYPQQKTDYANNWINLHGRLKTGISLEAASAELATLGGRLASNHPKELAGSNLRLLPLHRSNLEGLNTSIVWMMTGLALLVLIVACANLASIQLARALGRIREMAIRTALGASRWNMMAPLLCESLLLCLTGSLLGLIFAGWMNDWMGSRAVIGSDMGFDLSIDGRVLLFTICISLLTGIAFGLIPAWIATRNPAIDNLKEGSRGSTSGPAHNRLRAALVVGEISISLVLICTAAAFALAGANLAKRNLGWKHEGVFQGFVNRPWNRYDTDAKRLAFDRQLLQRLSAIPGMEKVSLSSSTPLFGYFSSTNLVIEGAEPVNPGQEPLTDVVSISSDYFSVLGIPLKEGAFFPDSLTPETPRLVIVNESFAKRFWPGQSALGHRFRQKNETSWYEITGVVGDVSSATNLGAPNTRLQIYTPQLQNPSNFICILARGSVPAEALAEPIRRELALLDQDLPLAQSGAISALIEWNLSNIHLMVLNLSCYAFMGLLISSIGIYGVLSHLANQRTRDIGVRLALGASKSDITRMILVQGGKLLAIGLPLGLLASVFLGQLLRQVMPGFGLPGLWLQVLTMALLAAITLVACWLPAHRAAQTSPLEALRSE